MLEPGSGGERREGGVGPFRSVLHGRLGAVPSRLRATAAHVPCDCPVERANRPHRSRRQASARRRYPAEVCGQGRYGVCGLCPRRGPRRAGTKPTIRRPLGRGTQRPPSSTCVSTGQRPVWVSKLERAGAGWRLWHYADCLGTFDAVVVAHNGKCAGRGTRSAPQKGKRHLYPHTQARQRPPRPLVATHHIALRRYAVAPCGSRIYNASAAHIQTP